MSVDQLVNDLLRPLYVLRLAATGERSDSSWGKSCRTRAANARQEIDTIVRAYVQDNSPPQGD